MLRVCDPRYFVFKKSRVPEEFVQYIQVKTNRYPRGLYYRKCNHFHDFTYNYNKQVKLRKLDDVDTDLVVIRWSDILGFYDQNVVNNRHYSIKHAVNKKRIRDIEQIGVDRIKQIIDVCSAGLWKLTYHDLWGYAIEQNTLYLGDLFTVINHNQWVLHNIGLISKLNSMYYQKDNNGQ